MSLVAEDSVVTRSFLLPAFPLLNLELFVEVFTFGWGVVRVPSVAATLTGSSVVEIAPSAGGLLMKLGRVGRGRAA